MKDNGKGYRSGAKRWYQFCEWMRTKGGLTTFCAGEGSGLNLLPDDEHSSFFLIMFLQWLVDYCGLLAVTAAHYRFAVHYDHARRRGRGIDTSSYAVKLAIKGLSNQDVRERRPRLPVTVPMATKMAALPDSRGTTWWFVVAQAWALSTFGRVSEYTWARKRPPSRAARLEAVRIRAKRPGRRTEPERKALKKVDDFVDFPKADDVVFIWKPAGSDAGAQLRGSDPRIAERSDVLPDNALFVLRKEKNKSLADDKTILQLCTVADSGAICGVQALFEHLVERHRRGASTEAPFARWKPLTKESPLIATGKRYGLDPLTPTEMRSELQLRLGEIGIVTRGKDSRGEYNRYKAHSYRHGAASQAAAAGIPLATIKEWGRWRSDAALLYLHGAVRVSNRQSIAMMKAEPSLVREFFAA